jgi:signal peptidase I
MIPEAMASAMIGSRPVEELASQVLRQGRGLWIKARGGSMTPFLRDGDVAFVMPAGDGEIRVGDVICYESTAGRLFLHRVVTRQQGRVVTKGDALTSADVICLRQILGTVSAIARRGRVRRLDTRSARWENRVIASLSPALSRLVHLAVEGRDLARAMLRG